MPTLPEQIRQALGRRDGVSEEALRPLAIAYNAEVVRVNERLAKAVALLHKGLRSEAIQMASMPPNAIDAAAALDFPEFGEWCEILQFLGVPVPEELNRDLADQLSEAIVDTQPLEGLLTQHRRLAIARAPLAWRLKVLRRIAEMDPMNQVWEEDIETWETARLKQIDLDVNRALTSRDPVAIQSLHQELAQSAWRIPPSDTLTKRLGAALTQLHDDALTAELAALAPKLHEAFCEFDEAAARRLLVTWNEVQARTKRPLAPELTEQVEGAIEWIAEMDRENVVRAERAAALARLESALDRGDDRVRLDAALNACNRFDEPPPIELIHRYQLAADQWENAAKRRNQAILAGIACVALIAVGLIIQWQRAAAQERAVVDAETQLKGMLDQSLLTEATSFLQRTTAEHPAVVADPRIASLESRLQGMVSEESSRATQFADYLATADVEQAADMDFSALAKAEGIAKTEEEKAAAFRVRRRYSAWDNEIQAEHTRDLVALITMSSQELDRIEETPADQVDTADINQVVSQLEEGVKKFRRADSSTKEQVNTATTRARSMRDALTERRRRMQAEKFAASKMLKASSLDELAESLVDYGKALPDSAMADEYAETAGERAHWDRPEAWNRFVDATVADLRKEITVATATRFSTNEADLRKTIGENLAESSSSDWRKRFNEASQRATLANKILGELPETVIADLYTAVESNGTGNRQFVYKSYYDSNRERFTNARTGIEVISNDSGAIKAGVLLTGPFKVIDEPYATIQWLTGLHQTASAQVLTDWEGFFLKTIGQLRARPNLDKQHKEMLIQHLLAGACEGSDWLASQLVQELLVLRSRAKNREFWFQPTTLLDTLDVEVESKVIQKVATLYRTRSTPMAEANLLQRKRYAWVGFLDREESGNIKAVINKAITQPGSLAITRPSINDPSKTDIMLVGMYDGSKASLTENKSEQIAGRPLFFLPK